MGSLNPLQFQELLVHRAAFVMLKQIEAAVTNTLLLEEKAWRCGGCRSLVTSFKKKRSNGEKIVENAKKK